MRARVDADTVRGFIHNKVQREQKMPLNAKLATEVENYFLSHKKARAELLMDRFGKEYGNLDVSDTLKEMKKLGKIDFPGKAIMKKDTVKSKI